MHVGTFPWEPSTVPLPVPMAPNPAAASNVSRASGSGSGTAAALESGARQVRVKQENEQNPQAFQQALPANYGATNLARERAMQNIQQKFGSEAQPQINRLQAQAALNAPMGQAPPVNGQYPPAPQYTAEQQRARLEEYHRAQVQTTARLQNPPRPQPVVGNGRTDGADEWDDFVAQRRLAASDPDAVQVADMTFRERFEQSQRDNEGGGLLLPASEQSKSKARPRSAKTKASGPSGFDGLDDDEDSKADVKDDLFDEDDADAINSDLDDPDDNVLEDDGTDGRPDQVMLCTYDKVQRVKNKWKCTLKDGVLNTGGKE